MSAQTDTTQGPHVAVVGAGPVGLSAALLLSRAGIRSTVIERDAAPSVHPKARGIRPRTMELFTQWGLADRLRENELPPEANRFIYCDALAGEEIARSPEAEPDPNVAPIGASRVAQDRVTRVLLEAVMARPDVELCTGETVTGLTEHEDRVELVCASGATVVADYIIAADGVGSTVRRLLAVRLEGKPVTGYGQSIYWHGDLGALVDGRLCIQFVTGHRLRKPANIATVDGHTRWVTMIMQPPSAERPEPPTPEEAVEVIKGAVGASIDVEVIDIATWRMSATVAERWRVGRVFLAGDAAHSFPPTGGFGMNTGVQDVHNLVWKLALVLGGEASGRLLDSYEAERMDIARSNAAWSLANGTRMRAIGEAIAAGDDDRLAELLKDQRGHVDATDQDLGFGYARGAFVPGAPLGDSGRDALRIALPGHRFPATDVVLDGVKRNSVLGLGDGFVLVTDDPDRWEGVRGVTVVETGRAVLGDASAALVRPDGIVAWLAGPDAGQQQLAEAFDHVLGRTS